jgi:hypothetical protein
MLGSLTLPAYQDIVATLSFDLNVVKNKVADVLGVSPGL